MKRLRAKPGATPGKGGFLQAIRLKREAVPGFDAYPFCVPCVRELERLELHPAVTFLVGENGTGKSTLLEALAVKLGFNAEGGSKNFNFASYASHSGLHKYLAVEKTPRRATDGFFLRAESFYNLASEVDRLGVTRAYGDKSLHAQSHGESFLAVLTNRLQGEGIYILDEPEAALSPSRLLSVLIYIHRLVFHDSQLIIATHSPILLAYPNACIYLLSEKGFERTTYAETEHYQLTKYFLDRYEHMLELLLKPEEQEWERLKR
jgi:predicted ATPase